MGLDIVCLGELLWLAGLWPSFGFRKTLSQRSKEEAGRAEPGFLFWLLPMGSCTLTHICTHMCVYIIYILHTQTPHAQTITTMACLKLYPEDSCVKGVGVS